MPGSLLIPLQIRSTPDIKNSLEASCVPEVERLFWEASRSERLLSDGQWSSFRVSSEMVVSMEMPISSLYKQRPPSLLPHSRQVLAFGKPAVSEPL